MKPTETSVDVCFLSFEKIEIPLMILFSQTVLMKKMLFEADCENIKKISVLIVRLHYLSCKNCDFLLKIL